MTDFFIKMKKQLYIFCLLLIGFGLITYGCGLITMIVYGQIIKPTETWYFSKGYDKKIISSNIKTEISDSSNISFRSLRLDKKIMILLNLIGSILTPPYTMKIW